MFVYTPLVQKKDYIKQESNTFLNRFYNGEITNMLSAYLENDNLSETELNDLRSLLARKKDKGANNLAQFAIRFLICNFFIIAVIGTLLLLKHFLRSYLSPRIQYNLWFLLFGIMIIPFLHISYVPSGLLE